MTAIKADRGAIDMEFIMDAARREAGFKAARAEAKRQGFDDVATLSYVKSTATHHLFQIQGIVTPIRVPR